MKFSINLKLFGILLILLTIVLSRISRKLKSKKGKTKNVLCPKLKPDVEITVEDVFPADSQGDEAKKNAEIQTKAARELFYNRPKKVLDVLKNVAIGYTNFILKNKDLFAEINKIQRQTAEDGTWQVYKQISIELNIDENKFHEDVVQRIINGNDVLPRDYLGFLGLLGDIGASVQDVINRNLDIKNEEDKPKFAIKDALVNYFGNELVNKSKDFYSKYSPDTYYDIKNQRSKRGDRKTCTASGKRSGVMNVGGNVDNTIDVGSKPASSLDSAAKLPEIKWPWQTVKKSLIDFCPKEPWAGHFSATLTEIILMLELFDRDLKSTTTEPTSEKKKTFAAIGSAFLVATGMHSAVEVIYVDKLYTEEASLTPDKILTKDVCNDATKWVSELISSQSKK